MMPSIERILQEALELPEDARVDVATALLDSVDDEPGDPAVEEAWRQEAKRRLDGIRSGERKTIPWEEARRLKPAVIREGAVGGQGVSVWMRPPGASTPSRGTGGPDHLSRLPLSPCRGEGSSGACRCREEANPVKRRALGGLPAPAHRRRSGPVEQREGVITS